MKKALELLLCATMMVGLLAGCGSDAQEGGSGDGDTASAKVAYLTPSLDVPFWRYVRHGVEDENITAAWVPGAFEIPTAASKMAASGKYDAVICVGAVIRGDTTHYDYVCNEVSKGIAQVGLATGVPVLFGVITTENIEQAISRAGSKGGNKGYDCALSAIEMVNLLNQIDA